MPSKHILKANNKGFTLLELLMVVTILSAVAWMSLGVVNNNMDQVRFDDTRNRLESIRRAIIGETSRTINGQPEIRGYVADMGNLPSNLQALLQKDYCEGYPAEDLNTCAGAGGIWIIQGEYCSNHSSVTKSTCTSAGEEWIEKYSYDEEYGLWTGWNGPYLKAKELSGYAKFRDGWGNKNTTAPTNDFGWNVTSSNDFTIQSYGKEGDSSGSGDYEVDYPPSAFSTLIKENEYKVTVTTEEVSATLGDGKGSITVNFGTPEPCWGCWGDTDNLYSDRSNCEQNGFNWNPILGINDETACNDKDLDGDLDGDGSWLQSSIFPEKICLKIAYRKEGAIETHVSVDDTTGTTPQAPNPLAESTYTWDGSRQQLSFVFPDNTTLPMGNLAYNLFEYDVTAIPRCTDILFQAENTSWSTFTIVPGTSTTPLNWKLQ